MGRGLIVVLNSLGCGGAEDAGDYGDAGAVTLGHIAERCAIGAGDRSGLRAGPLRLPHLDALGLGLAMHASPDAARRASARRRRGQGLWHRDFARQGHTLGSLGDRGHASRVRVGLFSADKSGAPDSLTRTLVAEGGLAGILANCHASGTPVIADYGEEHLRTLKPICYTSADSALQIAAHEEAFGLERLYEICRIARRLMRSPRHRSRDRAAVPWTQQEADFARTSNRKDFSMPPLPGNIFARATAAGREVVVDRQDRRYFRPSRHRARA